MIITLAMLNQAKSKKGGFNKKQIKYAQKLFPGKWKRAMLDNEVTQHFWDEFVRFGVVKVFKKHVKTAYSASGKPDWEWNDKEAPKVTKCNKKKKSKRIRVTRQHNDDFYKSREWRELRVRVIEKYDSKCMMCGRSPIEHGIIIHVDHIKSRSKYPELSLCFDNLQLLCADCNLGKSNKFKTDWRPEKSKPDQEEIAIVVEAQERLQEEMDGDFMVTKEWIVKYKTSRGSWTKVQMTALGLMFPPTKKWQQRMEGKMITMKNAIKFENGRNVYSMLYSNRKR